MNGIQQVDDADMTIVQTRSHEGHPLPPGEDVEHPSPVPSLDASASSTSYSSTSSNCPKPNNDHVPNSGWTEPSSSTTSTFTSSSSSLPNQILPPSFPSIHPNWVVPSSPPSPPLRYDPRCRATSPESPSPLFARWPRSSSSNPNRNTATHNGQYQQHQKQQQKRSKLAASFKAPNFFAVNELDEGLGECDPGSSTVCGNINKRSPTEGSETSAPLSSRTSSWISTEDEPMPVPSASRKAYDEFARRPLIVEESRPCLAPGVRPSASVLPMLASGYKGEQHQPQVPKYITAETENSQYYKAIQATKVPYSTTTYTTALGSKSRPGLAKLSRAREPTSTGKKRIRPTSKHAHKRSCSIQWQQFDRWQQKSRARLRDLLLLVLAMLFGTVLLWKFCLPSVVSTGKKGDGIYAYRRKYPLRIPALHTLPEPQRDTLVLYRILGNDLPPRHEIGQTLRNLRFMLGHENDFEDFQNQSFTPYNLKVQKYYVLNRITNATALASIMDIFSEFKVPQHRILNIPFEWEEYAKQQMRWDGGVTTSKNMWGIGPVADEGAIPVELLGSLNVTGTVDATEQLAKTSKRELMTKLRALEYATHDKNLYAINNNGGRNFALEHGRSLPWARWVMPLDGNCFFTPSAMATMIQSIAAQSEGDNHKKHIIVPMSRLLDNEDLHPNNRKPWLETRKSLRLSEMQIDDPDAPEEPQIGFRWDSDIKYQSEMRYGRRSKLELLWRLGAIPFDRNLHIKKLSWERQDHLYITSQTYGSASSSSSTKTTRPGFEIANGDFTRGGWVHRLFSGDISQEHSSTQAAELRRVNRMRGIILYLETLDSLVSTRSQSNDELGTIDALRPLWHWDHNTLLTFREAARTASSPDGVRLKDFIKASQAVLSRASRYLSERKASTSSVSAISRDALQLALAGYLTREARYTRTALQVIERLYVSTPHDPSRYTIREIGNLQGYAFPPLAERWLYPEVQTLHLSYECLSYDPSHVLDALSLIKLSRQYENDGGSMRAAVASIDKTLLRHMQVLLYSNEAIAISKSPPSWDAALRYDEAVAAMGAYFRLPTLVTRVRARQAIRHVDPSDTTEEYASSQKDAPTAGQLDAFHRGLANVAFSRAPDAISPFVDYLFQL